MRWIIVVVVTVPSFDRIDPVETSWSAWQARLGSRGHLIDGSYGAFICVHLTTCTKISKSQRIAVDRVFFGRVPADPDGRQTGCQHHALVRLAELA